jgi:antibiotic biosynthesis monooxygenase (ABM) superfamily enzyme
MQAANTPDEPPLGQPKRHKLMLLTWLGIYPTITSILWVMLPLLLPRFPLPVVTLIVTAIVVPLMSYVVMPLLLRRFADWTRR